MRQTHGAPPKRVLSARGYPLRATQSVFLRQLTQAALSNRSFRSTVVLRRHLDLDDVVLDGIHNQIANRVQAELPHDVAAMSFDRLGAQVEHRCDFLGALPFRKKLSDFALADGQGRQIGRFVPSYDMPLVEKSRQNQVIHARSEEHALT